MIRDFFLGFIKIHILYHAGKKPVYGVWLIEELTRHGYQISPGTLYPTLHALTQKGYLRCYESVVSGKVRKYYELTDKGLVMLKEARAKISELVREVLLEEDE
ncbi:helix-turn-helix transcriptional regulator [Candidatus Poribacteria bacterium]|nr:helix-turn-helix transcriptional regulator [Candidatus Poribacteria bacterium]